MDIVGWSVVLTLVTVIFLPGESLENCFLFSGPGQDLKKKMMQSNLRRERKDSLVEKTSV